MSEEELEAMLDAEGVDMAVHTDGHGAAGVTSRDSDSFLDVA
jgi:hypothetical protein